MFRQQSKHPYKPQQDRKKILLLGDDMRMPSGVGQMSKEIVINSAHHYNWVSIGGGLQHPDKGKVLDLSEAVNKETGLTDSMVKIYPTEGYGDTAMLREIIKLEKPDALFLFTDPRYWEWLFNMEREIRTKIPIFYLSIWDADPAPLYNESFYESCDLLMCISKSTKNTTEMVLKDSKRVQLVQI